jgi:hypothetical protein
MTSSRTSSSSSQPDKPDTTSDLPVDPPKPELNPFEDFKKLIASTDAQEIPQRVAEYQARRDSYSEDDRAKIDAYLKEKLS